MGEEKFEEEKISSYNSAALINIRLHEFWIDSANHKRDGKYLSWNGDLDAVWCELGGDIKDSDGNDIKWKKINQELAKLSPILNWDTYSQYINLTRALQLIQTQQYQKLMEKELFLRRLQNEQGKGTAYREKHQFN